MGTAVIAGHRIGAFKAVGVTTDIVDFCSPCGMCRQFLREFLKLETPIFMFNKEGKWIVRTMGELLPLSFGPDVLPPREELRKGQEGDKAKSASKGWGIGDMCIGGVGGGGGGGALHGWWGV